MLASCSALVEGAPYQKRQRQHQLLHLQQQQPRCAAAYSSSTKKVALPARHTMSSAKPRRTFHASARTLASDNLEVPVPELGDSIKEATVLEWVREVGDYVEMDDVVVVLETDKVSVDVRAPASGVITKTIGDIDDVVVVGTPIMEIDTAAEGDAAAAAATEAKPAVEATTPAAQEPKSELSPAAAAPAPTPAPTPTPVPAPANVPVDPSNSSGNRNETRVKMTRMRQTVARRLKEAQSTYAMLTTFQECDMGNVIDLRKKYKDDFEKVRTRC